MTDCEKYNYSSKSEAKKKKKEIEGNQGSKLYIYKCKKKGCKYWHFSTKAPNKLEYFREHKLEIK